MKTKVSLTDLFVKKTEKVCNFAEERMLSWIKSFFAYLWYLENDLRICNLASVYEPFHNIFASSF